jgi:hypothetical protein
VAVEIERLVDQSCQRKALFARCQRSRCHPPPPARSIACLALSSRLEFLPSHHSLPVDPSAPTCGHSLVSHFATRLSC